MAELTKEQKDYIIQTFFKNELLAGWKNIATKLVYEGKCVVAGERCIWVGGIGNFIETKKTDDFFGCLEYNFDIMYFIKSKWFNENVKLYLDSLSEQQKVLNEKFGSISSLYRIANL